MWVQVPMGSRRGCLLPSSWSCEPPVLGPGNQTWSSWSKSRVCSQLPSYFSSPVLRVCMSNGNWSGCSDVFITDASVWTPVTHSSVRHPVTAVVSSGMSFPCLLPGLHSILTNEISDTGSLYQSLVQTHKTCR